MTRKLRFRVGCRVVTDENESGTVVALPRNLAREEPQLVAVLIDNTQDAIVYHRDDLRRPAPIARRRGGRK
jgi:hypothetical protein